MAPPCFCINIISQGFITNITIHSHPEAIIYLFLISIGQKSICQPHRLLAQQLARRLWELLEHIQDMPAQRGWAGTSFTCSQGNCQPAVRSDCVHAKDKHQQGLLGIANTGEISMPIHTGTQDYTTLAISLGFI